MNTVEGFKPWSHSPPIGISNSVRYYIRLIVDFQVLSVYRHMKLFIRQVKGNILDLGCGESPYRFLIDEKTTKYYGLDIYDANKFEYKKDDIAHFDGKHIPYPNDMFDYVICTEVLEHCENYQGLIDEVYRVMKPDGKALFTIPWSARYHYIPYDYFRYTPSTLKKIFSHFSETSILPRGTDVTTISSKIIVLYFRNLIQKKAWHYIFFPILIMFAPLVLITIALGHVSMLLKIGNDLDPLGYTILIKK